MPEADGSGAHREEIKTDNRLCSLQMFIKIKNKIYTFKLKNCTAYLLSPNKFFIDSYDKMYFH